MDRSLACVSDPHDPAFDAYMLRNAEVIARDRKERDAAAAEAAAAADRAELLIGTTPHGPAHTMYRARAFRCLRSMRQPRNPARVLHDDLCHLFGLQDSAYCLDARV